MTIQVMSYNIHKGFSFHGLDFTLKAVREAIRDVPADIVFLQEVVGEHRSLKNQLKDWPMEPQFEFLADQFWDHSIYGKNAIYQDGHHGNAILSKFPFRAWENVNISNSSWEQRGLLHGIVDLGKGRDLHLICLHLDLLHWGRERQVQRLVDQIKALVPSDSPLIIAGDFNDWSARLTSWGNQIRVQEVNSVLHGRLARTYPGFFPILPLDRIYFRGIQPVASQVLHESHWAELSDHLAMFATFRLD